MDQLKKLGEAFANHYEKIILSVILLALLAAAALLPFRVAQNRETIRQALELGERARKKEQQPVDTAAFESSLKRLRKAPDLDLSGGHNLFNPVVWKKGRDGTLFKVVKGDEDGPGGLSISGIRPLKFVVEYDGIQTSGETKRYRFRVLDEGKGGRGGGKRQVFATTDAASKKDLFVVTKVNGPADDPVSLEIRLTDSGQVATVSKEAPFERIAGYEADLEHKKLGGRFTNVRAKQPGGIRLGSQTYNIVAITKDEVTVQSSTSKRWTVRLKGAS